MSVPGIQGCHEIALYKIFRMRPQLYVYASNNIPLGQPESRPDPEAGPKGSPCNSLKTYLVGALDGLEAPDESVFVAPFRYTQVIFNLISV